MIKRVYGEYVDMLPSQKIATAVIHDVALGAGRKERCHYAT
jgi:hypothetical protein